MKTGMMLGMGRQTVMSAQLQKSLGQLQMGALEFAQEVNAVLAGNPLLETIGADDVEAGETTIDADLPEGVVSDYSADPAKVDARESSDNDAGSVPAQEGDGMIEWGSRTSGRAGDGEPAQMGELVAAPNNLRDHLRRQVAEGRLDERERSLVEALVDCLDENGYLADSLDDIGASLGLDTAMRPALRQALRHLQALEPAGVGARDLADCLRIQLRRLAADVPGHDLAARIIDGHLPEAGSGNLRNLARALAVSRDEMDVAMGLIRMLDPRPARQFDASRIEYVIPDLTVRKHQGRWVVATTQGAIPNVRINEMYARAIGSQPREQGDSRLRDKLKEARWLVRSIEQRMTTIERVGAAIVARQQAWFDHGDIALKPMTLAQIADEVGVHESTVSRVASSKYMATPGGLVALRHFFSSSVQTAGGKACSAPAVKAMIRTLVAREAAAEPLSDHQLTNLLERKGIRIARRTVSKYRSAMGIESLEMRRMDGLRDEQREDRAQA